MVWFSSTLTSFFFFYTPFLTDIIPSIASQFYTRAEQTREPEKVAGKKMQMLAGRSKQENTGMSRPKGLLDGTMTDLLQDMKRREGVPLKSIHSSHGDTHTHTALGIHITGPRFRKCCVYLARGPMTTGYLFVQTSVQAGAS